MSGQSLIIDGIKWYVTGRLHSGVVPLCPKHYLRLTCSVNNGYGCSLKCAECEKPYRFEREFTARKQYILDKIDSKIFKNMRFINLDDEAVPLAESKDKSGDNKYFVTAKLLESKVGLRMVVYAGEQVKSDKTQIFVEPKIKRLAFDQSNLHPADVFLKLEGTFEDGTTASINKKSKR
jgi:hypothetical protein